MATRIGLQTPSELAEDDWNIGRFSRLTAFLSDLPGVEVTARDRRAPADRTDAMLRDLEGLRQTKASMANLAFWRGGSA